jgi:hypothetical protein
MSALLVQNVHCAGTEPILMTHVCAACLQEVFSENGSFLGLILGHICIAGFGGFGGLSV